ncbi:glycosyltransferase [Rhizobium sp. C1]|uniref:glycosyltransferase n=1 Tax=Rhizobium sp. C1 TaxID=1349799 RepID=UPI001E5B6EB5|nr:glycosyltransferase [Rhizobium sp. C1]MCD2177250.1 glycosyltransferase [Rhizobium sp. C1]
MRDDHRRLRILQVLEPSGGGSGRHFIDLCAGLAARGHRVTAVYSPLRAEPRFVAELQALRLEAVHSVAMRRAPHPTDLSALFAIRRIVRKGGPFDIIHGHSSKAGYLIRLPMPGLPHIPRIYTPHAFRTMDPTLGLAGKAVFGTVEALLGRAMSDKIICVSKDEHRHALRALHLPESRLATVVNGVATPPGDRRDALRRQLGFAADNFVFGFIGRLSLQKAPERLVSAFAAIAAGFPSARLLMIGFGELEAATRGQINDLGMSGKIVLTSDITGPEAIQAMDALVMPSRYEAMAYAMLEAAAAAKPMVLTEVGGASTVVEDGANGRLVKNSDETSPLAAAMNEFADPVRARRYAECAATRADRYSLDVMIDQTMNVYRNVILR